MQEKELMFRRIFFRDMWRRRLPRSRKLLYLEKSLKSRFLLKTILTMRMSVMKEIDLSSLLMIKI